MLSNDRLLAALKAEGLTVKEYPGWRTLCRCHNGSHEAGGPTVRPFDPVDVMVHITAGALGSRTAQQYIRDIIVSDPVTPLKSQFVTEPDGTVWIVSGGRCNHAGKVGVAAVAASRAQSMSLSKSYDPRQGSGADGNTVWYGIENIAASKMTAAQEEASVRICAAICRALGRTGQGVIGHGEASLERSRLDPNLDMGAFRRRVMARIASAKPSTSTPPTPITNPLDSLKEILMDDKAYKKLVADIADAVTRKVFDRSIGNEKDVDQAGKVVPLTFAAWCQKVLYGVKPGTPNSTLGKIAAKLGVK